jgi:hypothetical protein
MAMKPTRNKRAAPRKKSKTLANGRPRLHSWTRKDGEIHRAGYKISYARVSTLDLRVALQETALPRAQAFEVHSRYSGALVHLEDFIGRTLANRWFFYLHPDRKSFL